MADGVDPQIEGALGLAGTITAVLLFISPMSTFKRILANKSTEEFPSFPYVSAFLNCSVWVLYALPFVTPNRSSPLITNLIGLIFQTAYLLIYISHAHGKARVSAIQQVSAMVSFLLLLFVFTFTFCPAPSRSPILGLFATAFTVIMFGSPLSALAVVLQTRSVEFMPLSLSAMSLACSFAWLLYGIYVQDVYVEIPNALGVVLGLIQLAIYFYVRRLSPTKGSYEPVTSQVTMRPSDDEEGIKLTEVHARPIDE